MKLNANAAIRVLAVVGLTMALTWASGYYLYGYAQSPQELGERYYPVIYTKPDDRPTALKFLYREGQSVLIYYVFWDDEFYPYSPIIDKLYRFLRTLYYGSSEDIEVIKLRIDNGAPVELIFESYGHEVVRARILNSTHVTLPDGREVRCMTNYHPELYSVTWNHMLSLLPLNGYVANSLRPENLSLDEYVHFKIYRRELPQIYLFYDLVAFLLISLALVMVPGYLRRCLK